MTAQKRTTKQIARAMMDRALRAEAEKITIGVAHAEMLRAEATARKLRRDWRALLRNYFEGKPVVT